MIVNNRLIEEPTIEDNIWFWYGNKLVNIDAVLVPDLTNTETRKSYSFDFESGDVHKWVGKYRWMPHYEFGVDMWHTKREAVESRKNLLTEDIDEAVDRYCDFHSKYGED